MVVYNNKKKKMYKIIIIAIVCLTIGYIIWKYNLLIFNF